MMGVVGVRKVVLMYYLVIIVRKKKKGGMEEINCTRGYLMH